MTDTKTNEKGGNTEKLWTTLDQDTALALDQASLYQETEAEYLGQSFLATASEDRLPMEDEMEKKRASRLEHTFVLFMRASQGECTVAVLELSITIVIALTMHIMYV